MKTTRLLLASLLVCQVFIFQGCVGAKRELPEIKKDCTICHLSRDVTKEAPLLKKPVSDLCIGCHPGRKAPAEHKVDIVPTMKGKQLPLLDGKMTCITCHDPHKNLYGKLIRVPQRDLCIICHPM